MIFFVIMQSLTLWCWYTQDFPLKHVNNDTAIEGGVTILDFNGA